MNGDAHRVSLDAGGLARLQQVRVDRQLPWLIIRCRRIPVSDLL